MRVQGALYTSYDIITAVPDGNLILTGSHLEHIIHYFHWSGGPGTYQVDLPNASGVDGINLSFSLGTDFTGGQSIDLIPPPPQTINGDASKTLNQHDVSYKIIAMDGNWFTI